MWWVQEFPSLINKDVHSFVGKQVWPRLAHSAAARPSPTEPCRGEPEPSLYLSSSVGHTSRPGDRSVPLDLPGFPPHWCTAQTLRTLLNNICVCAALVTWSTIHNFIGEVHVLNSQYLHIKSPEHRTHKQTNM